MNGFSKKWMSLIGLMLVSIVVTIFLSGCEQQNTTTWLTTSATSSTTSSSNGPTGSQTTMTTQTTSATSSVSTSSTTSPSTAPTISPTTSPSTTPTTVPTTAPTATPARRVQDYFPLTPDVFFRYAGTGNEFEPMSVETDYLWPDRIQLATMNGATEYRRLFKVGNGRVQELLTRGELYVREDLSQLSPVKDGEILLMEPLVVGTSWLVNGDKRSITGVDVPVSTPAGSFKAIEVTTQGKDVTTRHYYAAGIGFVKMSITGAYEITQTFEKRDSNASKQQTMTFYYPRMTQSATEVRFLDIRVTMKTNEGIRETLARYFSSPPASGYQRIMSPAVTIRSVNIDPVTEIVHVDVSKNYAEEMKFGAEMEAAILRCLVNTVGHAYNVERVLLTLDGEPVNFGHVAMDPGQSFKVEYDGAISLDGQTVLYKVKFGDTLYRIAQMHQVTVQSIVDANNLVDPNLIYPGQLLKIPK